MINDEFKTMKKYNQDFKDKMMKEVFQSQKMAAACDQDIKDFKEKTHFFFDKMEFWSEHSSKEIRTMSDQFEGLKVKLDSKIEEMQFDLQRRAKVDDLR